ncbi:hypothetical protein [Glycomyces salinus]|uniref:hypothetical protein n=1 Tax=Glycomyces salinus TaxID=980294 RepID=UPI0018EC48DA|nr:hypothetical protein [Glycomyces salinus]
MIRTAIRTFRYRILNLGMLVVAIASAAALLGGINVVIQSAQLAHPESSYTDQPDRVVTADQRVPESSRRTWADTAPTSMESAGGLTSAGATIVPASVFRITQLRSDSHTVEHLDGRTWWPAPDLLSEGRRPEGGEEAVLASATADDLGAAVGDSVTLVDGGTEHALTVSGITRTLPHGAYFDSETALSLDGNAEGHADFIAVFASDDTDWDAFEAVVADQGLSTVPDERRVDWDNEVSTAAVDGMVEDLWTMMGFTVLAVATLLFGCVSLATSNLGSELRALSRLGGAGGQLRAFLLTYTAAGTILSLPLTFVLGPLVAELIHRTLGETWFSIEATAGPLLQVWFLLAAGAIALTVLSGRNIRAVVQGSGSGLKNVGHLPRAVVTALLIAGLAATMALMNIGTSLMMFLAVGMAMLLAVPLVVVTAPWLVAASSVLLRALAGRGWVMWTAARSLRHRMQPLGKATGMVAVAAVIGLHMVLGSVIVGAASTQEWQSAVHAGQAVVAAERGDLVAADEEELGGAGFTEFTMYVQTPREDLERLDGGVAFGGDMGRYTVDVTDGSMDDVGGTSIAMSVTAALETGVDVGDSYRAYLGDGTPLEVTVGAIHASDTAFPNIIAGLDLLTEHQSGVELDAVFLDGDAPDPTGWVESRPGTTIMEVDELTAGGAAASGTELVFLSLIVIMLVLGGANGLAAHYQTRHTERTWLARFAAGRGGIRAATYVECFAVSCLGVASAAAVVLPQYMIASAQLPGLGRAAGELGWIAAVSLAVFVVATFTAASVASRWSDPTRRSAARRTEPAAPPGEAASK